MMKQFIALRAFVMNPEGKVLILRESNQYQDGVNVGKYDVVGGRLEPAEHWREGLLREVKEETGLEITIDRPFCVEEWRPVVRGEQWHIVGTFFVCYSEQSEVELSNDFDDFQWIDPAEYEQWNLIGILKGVFEEFLEINN